MEIKNLSELIDFMNLHGLCELEIEEEGRRVKLKKYSNESPIVIKENTSVSSQAGSQKETAKEGLIEIKSPMVGTFYRAPSPEARPYVDVDEEIKPGDVVCIIEAMKLMNEIKSEVAGKVLEILVENGQAIEFGQPLFLVKTL